MTCMAAPEQTCIVKVILEHEEAFNLRQHRRNETMLKKRILDFIHQLRQRGFRHFIICVLLDWILTTRSMSANCRWVCDNVSE